jgi:hypothetical protein
MQQLSAFDLAKNELQNPRAHQLASAPAAPVTGQFYYNTVDNTLYWWNGTVWKSATGDTIAFAAVTAATTYGIAAGNGAATTVARSDHTHGTPALTANAASTQAIGDTAAVGTGTTPARDDHKHAMPAFGAVTAQTSFGGSSGNGSGAAVARNDHTHGTPTHDAAAHSTFTVNNLAVPTADVAWNAKKITGLADPTGAQDAATKAYVDSVSIGLDVKASVRAATAAAGTLATSFANGQVIDGVTLATGNRILIKNQSAGAENGIYTVNASGAPTRATDADTSAEVTAGMFTFVEEGTANADTGWLLTTNAAITLGTTALVFTQFSGAGSWTAGNGLTQTGTTMNVVGTANRITANADSVDIASTYAGQGSITTLGTITTGVWTGTGIAVADGGTGASTAAAARTNLGAVGKYAASVGNGALTSVPVVHSLGTTDVTWSVKLVATGAAVGCDVTVTDANTITLGFAVAPAASAIRVVVTG